MSKHIESGAAYSGDTPLQQRQIPLVRALGAVAAWSLTYSGIGVSAGIFSIYSFSLSFSGPAFVWGWPIVGLGTLIVCLMWAELASHYPFAGVMYQWPSILVGRRIGWFVGWLYLFAVIALVLAAFSAVQVGVEPLFGLPSTTAWNQGITIGAILLATVFNVIGIRALGKFTEWAVVAELVVVMAVTTLVLIFGHHQNLSIFTNSGGMGSIIGSGAGAFLGGGILVALWVFYFFETGGTLGEETLEASRNAPRAVLYTLLVTFIVGGYFLFSMNLAIPNVGAAMKSANAGTAVQDIMYAALPHAFFTIYLVVIVAVLFLGANVAFTAAVRHLFSMARDNQLPFSGALSTSRDGTPWVAVLVVAVVAGVPYLILSQAVATLITGATAFFYLVYFAVMCIVLYSRLRGWPSETKPFRLGAWGIPLNIVAIVWTGAVLVNMLWPRASTNPNWNGLPVAYWLIGVPAIVGAIYYLAIQHRRIDAEEALVQRGARVS